VACGRDFLSFSAHVLLDTLMRLLELLTPGVFPKLKVYVKLKNTLHTVVLVRTITGLHTSTRT